MTALIQRYRLELMPVWGAMVLYAAAFMVNLVAARLWPVAPILGAASTAAVLRWRATRRRTRAYALVVGLLATAWGTLAWWAGPDRPPLLVALLAIWVVAELPWLWHHRLEAMVASTLRRALDRENWLREQTARRLVKGWPALAKGVGLPGVEALSATVDQHGWTLVLKLPPEFSIAEVLKQLPRIEAAVDARSEAGHHLQPGAAQVVADPRRASRCVLRLTLWEAPPEPVSAPAPPSEEPHEPDAGAVENVR